MINLLSTQAQHHNPHKRICYLSFYARTPRWKLIVVQAFLDLSFNAHPWTTNLIKDTKISHCIFLSFSCVSYCNSLNGVASKMRYSKYFNRVGTIPSTRNSHFSIFRHNVQYLETFLDDVSNRSSFFRTGSRTKDKDAHLQQPFSSDCERYTFFGKNKHFMSNS